VLDVADDLVVFVDDGGNADEGAWIDSAHRVTPPRP